MFCGILSMVMKKILERSVTYKSLHELCSVGFLGITEEEVAEVEKRYGWMFTDEEPKDLGGRNIPSIISDVVCDSIIDFLRGKKKKSDMKAIERGSSYRWVKELNEYDPDRKDIITAAKLLDTARARGYRGEPRMIDPETLEVPDGNDCARIRRITKLCPDENGYTTFDGLEYSDKNERIIAQLYAATTVPL